MAATDLENQTQAQSGESPETKDASPSKAATQTPEERKAAALMALVTGKRHMLVQDIPAAVSSLGEACELLSAEFGETAPECAEAYFYYGKALLEMARLEAGVLGNGLDGDGESEKSEEPEDEDEDEDEEESPESGEGEAAEPEAEKGAEGAEKTETDSVEGDKKEGEDAAAQEAEDEDDPSNLQLAWEMLELAKMVFTEQLEGAQKASLTEELKATVEKKLCETFLTLGEVSLENENYVQAVEDLNLCLERQKASLPSDSRNIAETLYQLGVALGFHMKYEEAVASLEAAIAVLDSRIKNLKEKTESPDEAKKNDAFYTREKEIAEIEALIPEIKEKITDTNEMKDESIKKVAELKEQIGFGSSSSSSGAGSSTSTAKPIATISFKRKKEEEITSGTKKVKNSENGEPSTS
eukprot:TRINITY_DN1311_c0_g1_i1.p1 TRINITY_DN1311_c0_g1~~TRINITY_DN1311_c0_g1_i1.p1  ORF type:complete len:412 (-),score=209.10 TRINITY_DN1311_c0_g1_i1:572-1807(-)